MCSQAPNFQSFVDNDKTLAAPLLRAVNDITDENAYFKEANISNLFFDFNYVKRIYKEIDSHFPLISDSRFVLFVMARKRASFSFFSSATRSSDFRASFIDLQLRF